MAGCDDDCLGARCACVIQGGEGMDVDGAGTANSPFVVRALGGDEYQSVPPGVLAMHGAASAGLASKAPSAVPAGWLLCDGAAYSRTAYPELFAAIGTTYGGAGSSFNVPDMVAKLPMGADALYPLGSDGGSFTSTLVPNQMPAHTHTFDHGHGGVLNTGYVSSDHAHSGYTSDAIAPIGHNHGVAAGTQNVRSQGFYRGSGVIAQTIPTSTDGLHNHSVSTSGISAVHTHALGFPAHAGQSGSVGASTPVNITNPYLALGFIIKT